MNKPSKQTISRLTSAFEQLEVMARPGRVFTPGEATCARDYVREALAQLTEDKQLPCGGLACHVTKPTVRALAAHRNMCLSYRRTVSARKEG